MRARREQDGCHPLKMLPMSDATGCSYDAVASRYSAEIGGELAAKPLDRAVLNAFVEMIDGPMLDIGGGPGHVADYLAHQGATVASSDLSPQMCQYARRRGINSIVSDMTSLPFGTDSAAGIICLYAVIHLDAVGRAAAYASFRRVLRAGGLLLVAFHTSDADHQTGAAAEVSSWWGRPVALTFRYLDPGSESDALYAAGFEVVARIDRAAGQGEHASERTYLLMRCATDVRPPERNPVDD